MRQADDHPQTSPQHTQHKPRSSQSPHEAGGTPAKEKDPDGTVYLRLDDDQAQRDDDEAGDGVAAASQQDDAGQTADQITLIEALQAEVKFLREKPQRREAIHTEEARRKDTIITTMAQRISKLEAALEPRESPMSEPPGTVGRGARRLPKPARKRHSAHGGIGCLALRRRG